MKNSILILTVLVLLFSCKKEEKYNCVDGSCVTSENGTYSSKEDCQNQCSSSSNTGSTQDDYYESSHPEIISGTGQLYECDEYGDPEIHSDDGNWVIGFYGIGYTSGSVDFTLDATDPGEAEMSIFDERDASQWTTNCGMYDVISGTGSWNGNVFTYSVTFEDQCVYETDPNQYTLEGQFTCQ